MSTNDYFYESVPDGIANAINDLFPTVECCGQDAWEVLVKTYGEDVCGDDLKNCTSDEFGVFATAMKEVFEMERAPTSAQAKAIIDRALKQWGA